jgi:zinc transport system substrate-binding protein
MRKSALLAAILALVVAGAARADAWAFTVSVPPQKAFVKAIGGDRVTVSVMAGPGANPHAYEPRPRQMAALAASRIYFTIGVPFEDTWMKRFRAVAPALQVVATHGPDQTHDHEHEDPHVWVSPPRVREQADVIRDALIAADPPSEDYFRTNHARFVQKIDVLDREIRALFAGTDPGKRHFLAFHPAWGAFARTYGLTQMAVEKDGKPPGPRQVARIIKEAESLGIRVVFAQPEFSTRSAQVIARAIGGTVIPASPLAEDWAENLRRVARAFKEAMK